MTRQYVILGAPRTKKTSNRVVRLRGKKAGRPLVLPSQAWVTWCRCARIWNEDDWIVGANPGTGAVNCRAIFYRDANRGDAVGYYQGLADLLQKRGIVADDKLIVSWDGSRLAVDRKRPRVEITLTEVAG
jgi:hypothetical protein